MPSVNNDTFLIKRIQDLANPMEPIPTGQEPKLEKLDGIKAIVFDVYGTLFVSGTGDTNVHHRDDHDIDCFDEAINEVDLVVRNPDVGEEAMMMFWETIKADHEEKKASGIAHPEVDIIDIWYQVLADLKTDGVLDGHFSEEVIKHFTVEFEFRFNPSWPMPELPGLFDTLKKEYTLGIVSNSQFYTPLSFEAFFDKTIAELGFDQELLILSYQHGVAKPDISLYEQLVDSAKEFGLKPENILYIGNDLLKDVLPAREVGVQTALFAGDKRSLRLRVDDKRVKGVVPDLILTDLGQIEECV